MPTVEEHRIREASNAMGEKERRAVFFGWADEQVLALLAACVEEVSERGINVQLALW